MFGALRVNTANIGIKDIPGTCVHTKLSSSVNDGQLIKVI